MSSWRLNSLYSLLDKYSKENEKLKESLDTANSSHDMLSKLVTDMNKLYADLSGAFTISGKTPDGGRITEDVLPSIEKVRTTLSTKIIPEINKQMAKNNQNIAQCNSEIARIKAKEKEEKDD